MNYIGKCDCCGKFFIKLQLVEDSGRAFYLRPQCKSAMLEVRKMFKIGKARSNDKKLTV